MLEMVQEKIRQCTKCPELVQNRINTVPGEGNTNAKLVFIGEAPGATENQTGRPFVGKAGQLLDVLLENCGIKRDEVFILNTICCKPEHNRIPYHDEMANCRPFLDLRLKVIDPRIIVCLGATAAKSLLGETNSVNNLRNEWYNYGNARVRVTFHPSYLLRNPADKKKAWDDFQVIKEAYRGLC